MAIETGPLPVDLGRDTTDMDPGIAQTVIQTAIAYGQAMESAAAYNDAAGRFITENGAAVVDGHATVGDPGHTGGAGDVGEGGMFGGAGDSDY
jgi:hypothetical protein